VSHAPRRFRRKVHRLAWVAKPKKNLRRAEVVKPATCLKNRRVDARCEPHAPSSGVGPAGGTTDVRSRPACPSPAAPALERVCAKHRGDGDVAQARSRADHEKRHTEPSKGRDAGQASSPRRTPAGSFDERGLEACSSARSIRRRSEGDPAPRGSSSRGGTERGGRTARIRGLTARLARGAGIGAAA
jgi:hypothetical protein